MRFTPYQIVEKIKSEILCHETLFFAVFIFFVGFAFSFLSSCHIDKSAAATLDNFRAGNIISDAVMANSDSMTKEEIQRFLTQKNPCNNTNYKLYEEQSTLYPNITWHWSGDKETGHFVCISEETFGEGTEIGVEDGETAAEIIYNASQEYHINPEVLIVLLEKEQGLITDDYPHSRQYRSATGYGCPDTAACDAKYYGFKNQIYRAAELFRYTLDHGSILYPEQQNGVYVAYNPSSACGGTEVYIENRATAALYRYTPYQPNSAALAAGSGTGDSCSAYGNRNFYLFFTRWFGSTQAAVDGDVVVIPSGIYNFKTSDGTLLSPDKSIALWHISRDASTGYYSFYDSASKKYLALPSNAAESGTKLVLSNVDSCAKWWKPYITKDGYFVFESSCASGMVITNSLTLDIYNNKSEVKWAIFTGQSIDEGSYILSPKFNTEKAMDISEGRNQNGANIQLWSANGQWPQNWRLEYLEEYDAYTITNPYSGKLLDLSGARTTAGTNIQLWQNTNACAQRWKFIPDESGYYTIVSSCAENRAIDLPYGRTANNTNIHLWSTNDDDAERWYLSPVHRLEDGDYTITAADNDKQALDISGGRNQNGANIQLWSANGQWPQNWRLEYLEEYDAYTITNPYSGKLLDLSGARTTAGTNIQLWQNTNACAQRWLIYLDDDGLGTIISSCDTNRAADLSGGKTINNTNVYLWPYTSSSTQKWIFTPKSEEATSSEPAS